MNRRRIFIGGFIVMTGLLAAVVIFDFVNSLLLSDRIGEEYFSKSEILYGILAEGIRGYIVMYIYTQIKGAGSSLTHGMTYGILMSLMVGSIWIILGKVYYGSHLLSECITIILQGVFSGAGLWMAYRIVPAESTIGRDSA